MDGGANEGVGKDGWNGVDVGNEEKSLTQMIARHSSVVCGHWGSI